MRSAAAIICAGLRPQMSTLTIGDIRNRRWKIYGMDLPDAVLETVYHRNADKIFSQFKGQK